MGAHKVIVLDRLPQRLALAEEFGADHTINIEEFNTPETRRRAVWDLTEGRGANIVMELVGRAELPGRGSDLPGEWRHVHRDRRHCARPHRGD